MRSPAAASRRTRFLCHKLQSLRFLPFAETSSSSITYNLGTEKEEEAAETLQKSDLVQAW